MNSRAGRLFFFEKIVIFTGIVAVVVVVVVVVAVIWSVVIGVLR